MGIAIWLEDNQQELTNYHLKQTLADFRGIDHMVETISWALKVIYVTFKGKRY